MIRKQIPKVKEGREKEDELEDAGEMYEVVWGIMPEPWGEEEEYFNFKILTMISRRQTFLG